MWKRILWGSALLLMLCLSTGCCRLWDRWCAPRCCPDPCRNPCYAPPAAGQGCAPNYPYARPCD